VVTESYFLIILSFGSTWQPLVIDFFPDMKSCQNAMKEITTIKNKAAFGNSPVIELDRMKCIPKQVD
jgi:hypothetical protein